MSIYDQLKKAGTPLGSHESDLYAKVTKESKKIVREYEHKGNVTIFKSQIDGLPWFEIPFAFNPWWDEKLGNLTGGRLTKLNYKGA